MTVYRISARCLAQPPEPDWRAQLARRLGARPRRLGRWAELGLYGALECLGADAHGSMAQHAALLLSSQHGPAMAMRSALEQAREGMLLPLTFLQTQPSQLLAALSAQLCWRGDARFIAHADPLALLALALAGKPADGLLIGWVDELETERSVWLRLEPEDAPGGVWREASDFAAVLENASHLRLGASRVEVIMDAKYINADQPH